MGKMEVAAEPWKAIKFYSPFLIIATFYSIFAIYIRSKDGVCVEVFGYPFPYLSFLIAVYGLALVIFIASIYQGFIGYKILKSKANPPPGIPVFFSSNVTYGFRDKVRCVLLLVLYPAFGIGSLFIANDVFFKVMDGRSLSEFKVEFQNDYNTHNK